MRQTPAKASAASAGRKAANLRAKRLPLGRLRDLLVALRAQGRIFALLRDGPETSLAPMDDASPARLTRELPTRGPGEPVLPPADAFFGLRSEAIDMRSIHKDSGRLVLFAIPPCMVYSIRFLDRLLASGPFQNADYAARRSRCLIVAMNCTAQRRGCYCSGLGIGPALRSNRHADIALAPVGSGFLVESGSAAGAKILSGLNLGTGDTT